MTAGLTVAESRAASRIVVVDDDPDIRAILADHLRAHGFIVDAASSRGEMDRHLARGDVDLVVLDLRLGADDGLDVLRSLRAERDVPVIVLTGHRRDEVDRIVGLELGADDYLTKPVGLKELVARVRSVLRRTEANGADEAPATGKSRFAGWVLNRRLRTLTDPAGQPVKLTKGEYAMLVVFLDAPGRPLSRDALLQATRIQEDVFDRSIDVQILRLRRKLEHDPASPTMIVTERGFGYVFAVPVETTR